MFSLFDGGIQDTLSSKFIDLPDLVRIIRSNPHADKIDTIRNLRKNGDDYYKTLKRDLPNITPNCIVKVRNLKEGLFDKNFIYFSQYMYFDIDITDPKEYKEGFITRYKKQASMVCLSSSGGGISALFKLKNKITKDNFDDIWLTVRNTILVDEPVDMKCKNIGRSMFISKDPSVFYNYENYIEVELPDSIAQTDKKEGKQCKTYKEYNSTLISPFSIPSIGIVLQKLITSTQVDVYNPIVDFKPVEYHNIYIPEHIKDGTKHIIYTSMIHALVDLNPNIEKKYIYSYLFFVNNRFAKPKMEKREFNRTFNSVYEGIKKTGNTIVKKRLKYVHFNPNCHLTKKEKNTIANMLNGSKRKNESIQKIIDAKIELGHLGQKITQKRISEISGLSPKTVRTHLNSTIIDIDDIVEMIHNSVPIVPFNDDLV